MTDVAAPPAFMDEAEIRPRRSVTFELPTPTPTLNDLRRLRHDQYHALRLDLGWDVRTALNNVGYFSQPPMERASIVVMRYGLQAVDPDGAAGGCKPLLDVLVMPSPSHPTGLGVIRDDDPRHLEFRVVTEHAHTVAEQRTVVIIAELDPLPEPERPPRKRSMRSYSQAAKKAARSRKRAGKWGPLRMVTLP